MCHMNMSCFVFFCFFFKVLFKMRFPPQVFTDLFVFALTFSLQGAGQEKLGIYIKSVVKGGAADVVSPHRQSGIMKKLCEKITL